MKDGAVPTGLSSISIASNPTLKRGANEVAAATAYGAGGPCDGRPAEVKQCGRG